MWTSFFFVHISILLSILTIYNICTKTVGVLVFFYYVYAAAVLVVVVVYPLVKEAKEEEYEEIVRTYAFWPTTTVKYGQDRYAACCKQKKMKMTVYKILLLFLVVKV